MTSLYKFFNSKYLWPILIILALTVSLIKWTLGDIVFALIVLCSLFHIFITKNQSRAFDLIKRGSPLLILIFCWIACNIIGYAVSSQMGAEQWEEIFGFRWIFAFFACVYAGVQLPELSERRLNIVTVTFCIVLIYALIWEQFHPMGDNIYYGTIERFRGFYHNPNNFSLALVLPWAFLVGRESSQLQTGQKNSWVSLTAILIMSLALYGSFTRSAWIGMVVVFFAAVVLTRNKKLAYLTGALVVGSAMMFLFNILRLRERLLYSFQIEKGNSSALRLQIWKVNWEIFKDHPFFGVGFYENIRLVPEYYNKLGMTGETFVAHAHNQFLQILAASGVIGFAFYIAIFTLGIFYYFRIYKNTSGSSKSVALAGLMILLAFLFSGLTESPLMFHESRAFLLLLSGLCAGYLMRPKLKKGVT